MTRQATIDAAGNKGVTKGHDLGTIWARSGRDLGAIWAQSGLVLELDRPRVPAVCSAAGAYLLFFSCSSLLLYARWWVRDGLGEAMD